MSFFRSKPAATSSFESLALPLANALYATAYRLTGNAEDAQDLTQETLLKGYRSFASYQPNTNFRAWLFTILTNAFINDHRKRVRAKHFKQASVDDRALHWTGQESGTASLELQTEQKLLAERVVQAMDELATDFRTVVALVDLQDFSYQEVADMLRIPLGTVMSRLYRGRQQLKRQLGFLSEESADTDAVVNLASFRALKARG